MRQCFVKSRPNKVLHKCTNRFAGEIFYSYFQQHKLSLTLHAALRMNESKVERRGRMVRMSDSQPEGRGFEATAWYL
jgi:hypothetical protein